MWPSPQAVPLDHWGEGYVRISLATGKQALLTGVARLLAFYTALTSQTLVFRRAEP